MVTSMCVVPTTKQKGKNMSRYRKMSHTVWFCEYHIVWIPKYRYRIMQGKLKEEMELCIREQNRQMESEVVELNVQIDHVHMVSMMPPKVSISSYMGRLKGKTAIRMFSAFRDLRQRRYQGNHFWAQGYCVGTVGLDEEKIRKYVRWQERQEQKQEEFRFNR